MKVSIAVVLSALALAVSIAGWLARAPATSSGGSAPVVPSGLTEVPMIDPSRPLECKGDTPIAEVADLMKTRINPTMTKLSFALHHMDSDDRLMAAADAAGDMLGCVHLAPKYPPQIPLSRYGEYYHLIAEMQSSALALQTSALEQDDEGARHWFRHLKQSCVACHARFRAAEAE